MNSYTRKPVGLAGDLRLVGSLTLGAKMKTHRFVKLLILSVLLVSCNQSSENDSAAVESDKETAIQANKETSTNVSKTTETAIEQTQKSCEITMGWAPWEPYQYITRNGTLTGLDIEIVQATEKEMGCTIKFQQGDWAKLLELLKKGELDAVASAGMTENRREYAYFSEPYRSESYSIYVRKDELDRYSGQSIRSLLDSRMRLGAVSGYSYGVTVADYQDNEKYQKQFTYNEISEENFLLLFDNKVDGVLADSIVASDMIRRRSWSTEVARLPLVIHSGDVHVMFSKKSVSQEVVQKMNNALAKLKASGDYRRLIELYGG